MSSRYLNDLVCTSRGADMLALGLFPNGKEVTESFGAYAAVRTYLPDLRLDDPSVTVVAVGDGSTPRTAATFAMRSAWRCISVDPRMAKSEGKWSAVGRLTVLGARVEDVIITCTGPTIIVAVHSHATLPAALASVHAPSVAVVAIPCCVPQELAGRPPDVEFTDMDIDSPERRVLVWRRV